MTEPADALASSASNGQQPEPSWLLRQLEAARRLLATTPSSTRARRLTFAAALVLFVVATVVSFGSLPHGVNLRWWAAPIVIGVTPFMVGANAAEYRVMGSMSGQVVHWGAAIRLTVLASAANLLPLPGGVLVRTQALRQGGSSYRRALAANALAGLAWVGAGCLTIGALLIGSGRQWIGFLILPIGLISVMTVAIALRKLNRERATRLLFLLMAIEAASVAFSALRIYFAFRLAGLTSSPAQSVALTAAQIVSAAIGFVPSGLGLRELLAGGIGSAVGLEVSSSIAAIATERVATQVGLAMLCMPLLLRRGRAGDVASDMNESGERKP